MIRRPQILKFTAEDGFRMLFSAFLSLMLSAGICTTASLWCLHNLHAPLIITVCIQQESSLQAFLPRLVSLYAYLNFSVCPLSFAGSCLLSAVALKFAVCARHRSSSAFSASYGNWRRLSKIRLRRWYGPGWCCWLVLVGGI